jgi:hypothetical protein
MDARERGAEKKVTTGSETGDSQPSGELDFPRLEGPIPISKSSGAFRLVILLVTRCSETPDTVGRTGLGFKRRRVFLPSPAVV